METDPGKQRSRQKRREPALQLQQGKQTREEEEASGQDDHDESPPRSSKDKIPRSKPKKGKSDLFEEDIIDGFAIMSFKTLEELETVTKKNGCVKNKSQTEEDTSIKDTNSLDKDAMDKAKKKKIKKNAILNHCTNNGADSNENASDSNMGSAVSDNISNNNCINSNSNSEVDGSSSSGSLIRSVNNILITNDSPNHNYQFHGQLCNGPVDLPRSISRERLSDFDVDIGDDKVSESGSDQYPEIRVEGILSNLSSNGHNPCVALTVPTPPPSTSTTPITLCNGVGGTTNPFHSPVHQVLVPTTTTTTTPNTTTSSTSKPNFSDSLTISTSTAVIATAVPSQSVIHSSPYLPDHQGSKPSQLSPGSSSPQSHSKRTLSPSSSKHHQNHDIHFVSDNSSCARSLQYSRVHKSNHIQCKSKEAPPLHSPDNLNSRSNNSQQHHQHHPQHVTSENLQPSHLHNGPSNLNHPISNSPKGQANSGFPIPGHSSGCDYQQPPLLRPEPLISHHSSSPADVESRVNQICNNASSVVTNNGLLTTNTATTLSVISTSHNHNSQKHQHHHYISGISSHHRSSLPTTKSHHSPHHKHSSKDRSQSPLEHRLKRVCRTPTSVASTLTTASATSFNDTSKHLASSVISSSQGSKLDNLVLPSSAGCEKDKCKPKEGRTSSVGSGSFHNQHHLHSQNHLSRDHRDKDRERERDREKTSVLQSIPLQSVTFPGPKPAWPSTPGSLYSPLIQPHHPHLTPSPSLHALGPNTSSSHPSPLFPLPLAPPPPLLAAGTPTLSTGMFAPPIHPAPPTASHPTVSGQFSAESLLRGQDFLHQDLNNRLLAHHDSSTIALPPSPFVRSETHQHQHQHLHNHMHQHTYGGLSAGPLVNPAPPLYDKIPKFEAGVFRPSFEKIPKAFDAGIFRPNIVPSYSAAFASLLPPGPSGTSLASSLQGAFQPKKHGRWCAVHVRVAWEIYHRQQNKLQKDQDGATSSSSSSKSGADTKPLEPLLRPASHLLPGGGTAARPPESSLLASVARGLPDGIGHGGSSFFTSATQLGLSPFPRPSPYTPPSLLNPLGFSGLGSSMFASVHDMPPPGLPSSLSSSPHEWNRLHRTPSSFPSWPKSDAERDKDREKDRERELRKEEESFRERRGSVSHQLEDARHAESLRPKSRSRSRSPLLNGRLDHHSKSELGSYDKLSASSSSLKLKDERREDDLTSLPHHLAEREKRERMEREKLDRDRLERERIGRERLERERLEKSVAVAEREKLLQAMEQRDKFLQTGYLGLGSFGTGLSTHPGLLDRRVGFMGHPGTAYPFLDRPPVPTSMWSPFDKSAEIAHRVELERERERMALMARLSGIPSHLAALEQERLKEHILREQQEQEFDIRRQYLDRFNAEHLRAVDPLALGTYFSRTISPMFGPAGLAGLKSNSPHGIPVAPPPLIHSSSTVASTMLSRHHDNSPSSSSKSKGCSPADSTSDLKDKRDGSSTDPDAHLR